MPSIRNWDFKKTVTKYIYIYLPYILYYSQQKAFYKDLRIKKEQPITREKYDYGNKLD